MTASYGQQPAGTQYAFAGWQDGSTSNPRVIVAPAQSTTYTATFQTQYQITAAIYPPQGGAVSGTGWFNSGGTATLTAIAAAGYKFVAWNYGSVGSMNPLVLGALTGPQMVTATFEPVNYTVTGNWSVIQVATSATVSGVNSYGEVAGSSGSPPSPFLWVPISANSVVGTVVNLGPTAAGNTTSMETAVNDYGQVLFSSTASGGFFGRPVTTPPTLFTPTVENGTVGITTEISSGSGGLALNNFGQVGTYLNGTLAIWTPRAANVVTGVLTTNAQWQGLVAMNTYGQAIMNGSQGNPFLLFTPSAPNWTLGTFTTISGLAGSSQNSVVAINDFGQVVGYSVLPGFVGWQPFIWTPTSPNGTSGATVAMPVPVGFTGILPTAINLSGSVVGIMASGGGVAIPFLYIAGSYYDLSTISSSLAGLTPVGINQAGQVVLNGAGVYLVTPPLLISAPQFLPPGMQNYPYPTTTFSATGTTGGYTWAATGLPAGLAIDPLSGALSGIPTSITGTPFFVQVSVSCCGTLTASRAYLLSLVSG